MNKRCICKCHPKTQKIQGNHCLFCKDGRFIKEIKKGNYPLTAGK